MWVVRKINIKHMKMENYSLKYPEFIEILIHFLIMYVYVS